METIPAETHEVLDATFRRYQEYDCPDDFVTLLARTAKAARLPGFRCD
jgi:hypothetical protein